jgi:glucokinase
MRDVVVGMDVGGTNTVFGLVDRDGACLDQSAVRTTDFSRPEPFVTAVLEAVRSLLGRQPEVQLKGMGIGAPNGNYYHGTIEHAPNLQWKGVVPLADLFHTALNLPVALTNDANAAAIGEMLFGGAKGMHDFIVITLGTGVGSGIVVNGKLVYGHDGFAGELGHTIVNPEGRQCNCGRRGCLETYASAGGIKRTVFELLGTSTAPSSLRGVSFDALTAEQIAQAAQNGDEIACEAFESTGRVLGLKLADAVAHTSPEAIFLFGGLARAGDLIFEPTHRHMEAYMLNIFKGKTKLLPSGLESGNVAILGAAALIWKELEA